MKALRKEWALYTGGTSMLVFTSAILVIEFEHIQNFVNRLSENPWLLAMLVGGLAFLWYSYDKRKERKKLKKKELATKETKAQKDAEYNEKVHIKLSKWNDELVKKEEDLRIATNAKKEQLG